MKRRYCRRGHPRAPYILLVIVIAAAGAYAAGRMSRGYVQPAHTSPTAAPESVQTETIVLDAYSFYAIQFGAFDNDADARALTESYVSRGAAGYVLTDTRSRAIGAAYETVPTRTRYAQISPRRALTRMSTRYPRRAWNCALRQNLRLSLRYAPGMKRRLTR